MLNPLIHNTLLGAFDDYDGDMMCRKGRISIYAIIVYFKIQKRIFYLIQIKKGKCKKSIVIR